MKVTIPTTLKEMTVEQFMKYVKLTKLDGLNEDGLMVGTVAIFCNLSTSEVLAFPMADLKETYETITKVLEEKPEFLTVWNGLGFIPNLNNLTTAEFIDLDLYFHDPENYHRAMAVMYRPIVNQKGNEYTISEYKGTEATAEERLKMPLDLFLGAQLFFWTLSRDLQQSMIGSLECLTPQRAELEIALMRNGVGFPQYIQSLKDSVKILNGYIN